MSFHFPSSMAKFPIVDVARSIAVPVDVPLRWSTCLEGHRFDRKLVIFSSPAKRLKATDGTKVLRRLDNDSSTSFLKAAPVVVSQFGLRFVLLSRFSVSSRDALIGRAVRGHVALKPTNARVEITSECISR